MIIKPFVPESKLSHKAELERRLSEVLQASRKAVLLLLYISYQEGVLGQNNDEGLIPSLTHL